MPDNFNIQMTSQMAIAATTTYLIHCPTVFGSVRFSMLLLYLHFARRKSYWQLIRMFRKIWMSGWISRRLVRPTEVWEPVY